MRKRNTTLARDKQKDTHFIRTLYWLYIFLLNNREYLIVRKLRGDKQYTERQTKERRCFFAYVCFWNPLYLCVISLPGLTRKQTRAAEKSNNKQNRSKRETCLRLFTSLPLWGRFLFFFLVLFYVSFPGLSMQKDAVLNN